MFFTPAARAEIAEAVLWYRAHSDNLGDRFVAELDATIARVAANPRQFSPLFKDVRRARLQRFPYGPFFRIEDEAIYVIGCFHGRRNPRRWRNRT